MASGARRGRAFALAFAFPTSPSCAAVSPPSATTFNRLSLSVRFTGGLA